MSARGATHDLRSKMQKNAEENARRRGDGQETWRKIPRPKKTAEQEKTSGDAKQRNEQTMQYLNARVFARAMTSGDPENQNGNEVERRAAEAFHPHEKRRVQTKCNVPVRRVLFCGAEDRENVDVGGMEMA